LAAVSDFFSRACVPGKWSPDEITDQLFSEWRILSFDLINEYFPFFLKIRHLNWQNGNIQTYARLVMIHTAVPMETNIPDSRERYAVSLKDWAK
jgi:hypothetical protein